METELAEKMVKLADEKGYPHDHDFRVKASNFYKTALAYAKGECGPKELLRDWARARKAWCAETGDPLV